MERRSVSLCELVHNSVCVRSFQSTEEIYEYTLMKKYSIEIYQHTTFQMFGVSKVLKQNSYFYSARTHSINQKWQ